MQLTGRQFQQFSQVLREAFTLQRFDMMLRFRLDRNREDLALGDDYEEIAFKVIDRSQREGWTAKLLLAAREANPSNDQLLAFAQQFGVAPDNTPPRAELEKLINQANSYLDIAKWRTKLGEIETRVCRVEIQGDAAGTGFLVGPRAVLTNYHVVKGIIDGNGAPADVQVRFDYKRLSDGTTLSAGKVYAVDGANWLADYTIYDPVDLQPMPKVGAVDPTHLDYALLQIDGEPGGEPVGATADPQAAPRGWIEIPEAEHDFVANPALYIVQHPKGAPLKLAIDSEAVTGLDANRTRVYYRTNTEPGSSGSPCFDQNWDLVALHHSGDPNDIPIANEGIPIRRVAEMIVSRGFGHLLGEEEL
ncbi:MAG: trypsin-like peptidase domain-containing protein [Caldilineaceae bacterium]